MQQVLIRGRKTSVIFGLCLSQRNMLQTACNDTIISITWCDQENNLRSLFEL